MAEGDFFVNTTTDVASGDSATIDASSASTGAAEIHTISTTEAAQVFEERDTNSNGTYNVSFLVQSNAVELHSQKNKIEISSTRNMRLRILNDSGISIDIQVTGIEVVN